MFMVYNKNVCMDSIHKDCMSSRAGTAFISVAEFMSRFGDPHLMDESEEGIDGAGKVHYVWSVKTPRGTVHIRDYWWNKEGILSVSCSTKKQFLWVKGWLKANGVKCTSKFTRG